MKKRLQIVPGISLGFTIFIFAPIELYFSNIDEFWFSFLSIFPFFFGCAVFTVLAVSALLYFLPYNISGILEAFLYSLSILVYIQGNFIPNEYGILNGEEIQWEKYKVRFILDGLFWITIIVFFILMAYHYKASALKYMRFLASLIIAVQVLSLAIIGVSHIQSDENEENRYLSDKGLYSVSSASNVIVILLDCFDSEVMYTIAKEQPDFVESKFKDFVFFHNTVGGATRTKYAIPFIFTGTTNNEKVSYPEYLKKAYNESPFINELRKGDYDARIFTASEYFDTEQDSTVINNIIDGKRGISSIVGLVGGYSKIIGFKYAPDVAKKIFWIYTGDLKKWMDSGDDSSPPYSCNDFAFLESLKEHGLSVTTDKKCFRFIHLNGAHPPYVMNDNCELTDVENGTEMAQAVGSLKIVNEYLVQLKELGIYDSSNIIIMSDHGGGRGMEQNPLFMIKNAFSRKNFEISDIPLSYINLNELLAELLKSNTIDIRDYTISAPRFFYVESEDGAQINITEYASDGKAYDFDSFYATGVVYHGDTMSLTQEYKMGTFLSFAKKENARRYIVKGIGKNEGTHSWTNGNDAELRFELEGKYENIELEYDYSLTNRKQPVIIFANNQIIGEYIVNGPDKKTFIIPKDYIIDDVLLLRFSFPRTERGTFYDGRNYCMGLKGLSLSSTKQEFDLESQIDNKYAYGTVISFDKTDGNGNAYIIDGFGDAENGYTWTNGNQAELFFPVEQSTEDINVLLNIDGSNERQKAIFFVNHDKIKEMIIDGKGEVEISVPAKYTDDGFLYVKIDLPDADFSNDFGMSEDKRILGIKLDNIIISRQNGN